MKLERIIVALDELVIYDGIPELFDWKILANYLLSAATRAAEGSKTGMFDMIYNLRIRFQFKPSR